MRPISRQTEVESEAPLSFPRGENNAEPKHASEPRHQELKQARSLLEKGIDAMFLRERELAEECASLRSKVAELTQGLGQSKTTFAREIEARAAGEKNLVEQISSLVGARERERQEWQQELKGRDDSLKTVQDELDSTVRQLQAQQAAAAALKEQMVSLEMQQEEREILLHSARAEALAEREARIAAEEQAESAVRAHEVLKKDLVEHREREQQMQAHVTSLNTLFGRPHTNGRNGTARP